MQINGFDVEGNSTSNAKEVFITVNSNHDVIFKDNNIFFQTTLKEENLEETLKLLKEIHKIKFGGNNV